MDGAIWLWTDARRRSTNAQHRASRSWLQPASGLSIRPRPGSWKLFATVVRFDVLNDLPDDAAGIACGEHPLGLVAGHDAAGADDRARAGPHTWANDRPAIDPDVRADLYWFAVLDTASQFRVHRVQGRLDLHGRSEHSETADPHFADVEHDAVAVVVEVDRLPEAEIESIIAEERRLDADGLSPLGKELARHPPAFLEFFGSRCIECPAESLGITVRSHQLR